MIVYIPLNDWLFPGVELVSHAWQKLKCCGFLCVIKCPSLHSGCSIFLALTLLRFE